MYKVIKNFADVEDGLYIYYVGDKYPRDGVKVSLERAKELLGNENKIGEPLIAEIETHKKERKSKK